MYRVLYTLGLRSNACCTRREKPDPLLKPPSPCASKPETVIAVGKLLFTCIFFLAVTFESRDRAPSKPESGIAVTKILSVTELQSDRILNNNICALYLYSA